MLWLLSYKVAKFIDFKSRKFEVKSSHEVDKLLSSQNLLKSSHNSRTK